MDHTPRDPGDRRNYTDHPEYDLLDDGVQLAITPAEFAWMPDSERARFMRSIGEPDAFTDS